MNANGTGFFSKLFDMSFREYVTPHIIQFVFIAAIVLAGIAALGVFIALSMQGGIAFIGALIFAPITFLVYVLIARVSLEAVIALFRIAENTSRLADGSNRPPLP